MLGYKDTNYPEMIIIIRADSGFSRAAFYKLADQYDLKYAMGLSTNNRLKKIVQRAVKAVRFLYQNMVKNINILVILIGCDLIFS